MEDADGLAEGIRQRIATRLARLKLTPITAATKAGLPRDTIRNLFREGGSLPRVDTMRNIANALETTVSYLVGETSYPEDDAKDEDEWHLARMVMQTAKPISIVGRAEWGHVEPVPQSEESRGVLMLNVPGFEETNLYAVEIGDDHADLYYAEGRYVIWASRDEAGMRDGDHVVVTRVPPSDTNETREERWDKGLEYTVRELVTTRYRARSGKTYYTGGLASLSSNETYPEFVTGEEEQAGWMEIIGVVVADISFTLRPASPGIYAGIAPGTHRLDHNPNEEAEPSESGD